MAIHYCPLNSKRNEIRLLKIHDANRSAITPDLIQCSLEHVSLVLPPPYTALSYCWGDPMITKQIVLDGEAFEVTTNLHAALQELSRQGYKTLWVDAICFYTNRYKRKNHRNLRFGPLFSKGFRFLC
jgi:hypothetical protein